MEDLSMVTGYEGIGPEKGKYVSSESALAYAMERCGIKFSELPGDSRKEFRCALVEWFYSGNWIPVEQDEKQEVADRWAS
jgi:hypothetical protein